MKLIFVLLLLPIQLFAQDALKGEWRFNEIIMDGVSYPPPNPNLDLRFYFDGDKTSRLYWSRSDEKGFCERTAIYYYKDEHLYQKVTWVNPQNDNKCSQDQDMKFGSESMIRAVVINNKVHLDLQFGDKFLTYVLIKID